MDYIIENTLIVDGLLKDPYISDSDIKKNKIYKIKNLEHEISTIRIAGTNLILVPRFIDVHSHSDAIVLTKEKNKKRLIQGIRTKIIANCGVNKTKLFLNGSTLMEQRFLSIVRSIKKIFQNSQLVVGNNIFLNKNVSIVLKR